jgi:hypothetical protein
MELVETTQVSFDHLIRAAGLSRITDQDYHDPKFEPDKEEYRLASG